MGFNIVGGVFMILLFWGLAWAFFVKYDAIQGFFLSSVPGLFKPGEYRRSSSYVWVKYFTMVFFGFLTILAVASFIRDLAYYF